MIDQSGEAYVLDAGTFKRACERAAERGAPAPSETYLDKYGEVAHVVILAGAPLPDGELGDAELSVAFPFDRPVTDFLHGRGEQVPLVSLEDLFNGPRAVLEVDLADLPMDGRITVRETWVRTEARKVIEAFVKQAAEGDA